MLRAAAFLLAFAGVLHVLAPVVGGFANEATMLVPVGFVWLVVAYGLSRNLRWLAWIAFFGTMIAAIVAMSSALGFSAVPNWFYWSVASLHALALATLFGALWNSQSQEAI